MERIIKDILMESIEVKEAFIREQGAQIAALAEQIASAFTRDRKLLLCGNGGSAADAQHLAAEFVNRFQLERPPLPALALTTDTSVLTSIANDYDFDQVFSKQVAALGAAGDVLLVLTTSGRSKNIVKAVEAARKAGLYTAALLGGDGGEVRRMADLAMVVKSKTTARVQEAHILAGHMLCHLVDYILFQRHLNES
ncbi:Phosphoheptose isomerase [uncultured Desulfatiglans sp.]|nr:Phosphoheptose isomerase [uncultured Desulfatiglans sp.]